MNVLEERVVKDIGHRIAQVRGKMSVEKFAASLSIGRSSLIRYESGERKPDAVVLNRICTLYQVDANWLLMGQQIAPSTAGLIRVPLQDVDVSAGPGTVADQAAQTGVIAFEKNWLRGELNLSPDQLSLVSVRGDSMEPKISDGDFLLVDHQQNSIQRDGVYVFRCDGYLHVKRLQRQPGGQVRVTSDNPVYEAYTVTLNEDVTDFRVLGRGTWRLTPV
jgi:transcriptional regulator with XRE-family HTH domain